MWAAEEIGGGGAVWSMCVGGVLVDGVARRRRAGASADRGDAAHSEAGVVTGWCDVTCGFRPYVVGAFREERKSVLFVRNEEIEECSS